MKANKMKSALYTSVQDEHIIEKYNYRLELGRI